MSNDSQDVQVGAGGQPAGVVGFVEWELRDENGELKASGREDNIVTEVGDAYYALRGAPVGTVPVPATGMQLGTGTTAPSKSGAGAALVTLIASSLVALSSGFPQDGGLVAAKRRIIWQTVWAAGVATNAAIAEVVLVNQAVATQTVAPAANTIARALISPVVNKAAGDTLTAIWNHDLGTP